MRPLASLAALALVAGCGAGAPAEPKAPEGPPRLLIVSSLIGYIEPCGCTVDLLLGGIDRLAAAVAAERAEGPTAVLVVGSTLFEGPFPSHRAAQERAKAELLARSLGQLSVAAFVPGPGDLADGPERLAQLTRAFTAPTTGLSGRVLRLGALRVGILGLPPTAGQMEGDAAAPVQAEAQRLRAAGAQVVVALASRPRRAVRQLAEAVDAVDLWVLGDHPSEAPVASPAGAGYLIEAGDRGRNLGRIVLHEASAPGPLQDPVGDADRARRRLESQIKMKARMLALTRDPSLEASLAELRAQAAALETPPVTGKRFEYALLPITKSIAPDPELAGWVADYNAQLKALNLASAGAVPPVPEGGQRYVGVAECADCHPDAVAFWRTTPHARAWQTLVDADKTFDAECVGCHVVGWQQPGGTVLGQTEGLQDVQCEACHGPSERHAAEGGDPEATRRDLPEDGCVTCHHPHHSPKFDYASYRARILGPGHGAPLAGAALPPAP